MEYKKNIQTWLVRMVTKVKGGPIFLSSVFDIDNKEVRIILHILWTIWAIPTNRVYGSMILTGWD